MSEESIFEPPAWDERYSGEGKIWSGDPNVQLVAEASELTPGTALDLGCGEGGDLIWLARRGWQVTGADFSAAGLARAARLAEEAGVAERTDWSRVDAREFDAEGRTFDLVTSQYLHPPDGGLVDVVRRLARAVAPGGHLLVVGHAPPAGPSHLGPHEPNARHRDRRLGPARPPLQLDQATSKSCREASSPIVAGSGGPPFSVQAAASSRL